MKPAACLLALVLATPAAAQGVDGVYSGSLSCEIISGQTRRQLATDIRITIAGTSVSYEREILSLDGGAPTAIKERGTGTLNAASLSMSAAGSGIGASTYQAGYTGTITGGVIAMRGVQKWRVSSGNQDRPCTITAKRQ